MSQKPDIDELDLSDAELIQVLKNHDLSRRMLMKVFGVGAGVAAFGGTAAGQPKGNSDSRIDEVFGAPYSAEDTVPSGLPDHEVVLRGPPGPQPHEGFPMVDSREDGDFEPDKEAAEFYFDPVGLHIEPGDVVEFKVEEDHEHSVTSIDSKYGGELLQQSRIPADATAFSSPPVVEDESWLYRFEKTGVYDILCLPHLILGMVMRIVVVDPGENDLDDIGDYSDLPGLLANANLVLNDAKLDNPDDIVDQQDGEVAWADLSLP